MQHLDEGTIHAWLDGALGIEESAWAEAHVGSCGECADAVAEARGLIAASSRILTALDQVPSVRGSKSSRGSRGSKAPAWTGRPFAVAFVRQRVAAVVALVVIGGAIALTVARDKAPEGTVSVAAERVPAAELARADSPAAAPRPGAMANRASDDVEGSRALTGGGAAPPQSRPRRRVVARQADSAAAGAVATVAPLVAAEPAPPPARTLDSVPVNTVMAQAERKDELQASEGKSVVAERRARTLSQSRAEADVAQNYREERRAPVVGGATRAELGAPDTLLIHDERMTVAGQEVRRRIYRVDSILVTLDERLPSVLGEAAKAPSARAQLAAPSAPAARVDSVTGPTNTIRWRDARGVELTLTGPAPKARLERIRKLLGL